MSTVADRVILTTIKPNGGLFDVIDQDTGAVVASQVDYGMANAVQFHLAHVDAPYWGAEHVREAVARARTAVEVVVEGE